MAITAVIAAVSTSVGVIGGGAASLAFGSTLGFLGVGAVASHFLVTTALGLALNALTPKPSSSAGANRGYQVTQTGPALDRQVVYGRVRVAGARVFDATTGGQNEYLHRVLAFTGHEIESFDEIYIDDKKVTLDGSGNVVSPSVYNGKVRIRQHLGSPNQLADGVLTSEVGQWTSNHRLRGVSYIYVRFKFDSDVFPNGVPEITATVKGKKVYDPRTGNTVWSNNPALCLRDYLTNYEYGLGEDAESIDDSSVIAAANVSDPTGGQTRYTCNGAFTTGATPYDTLSNLLTSMGGLLWYAQGEWRMKPAYWTLPTLTLTEDDLRGNIILNTRHSRRDNYNTVRGTFRGSESNWQVTDYPKVSNPSFLAADNGQESSIDLQLPFTDNSREARRIANIALERNRQQLTISASFGMNAFQLQVGDNVKITNSRFGWTEKEFEVTSWTFGLTDGLDLQVQMVLREVSESVFDDISDGEVYERDNTTLPDALDVPPVGFDTSQDLRVINEQVTGVITVDITSTGVFADSYLVQYKTSGSAEYINVGNGPRGSYEIYVIQDGSYDIRVASVSMLGVKSPWSTRTIDFKVFSVPPQDVENFKGNVVGSSLHLSWNPVADLDLSYYKIRYSPLTSGASYSNAIDLVRKVARPANTVVVPAQTGTYFIKAVDKVGGLSVNSTSFVVLVDSNDFEGFDAVETITEHPLFEGAKDKVVANSDDKSTFLQLDNEGNLDSALGLFDEAVGLFDGGDGSISPSGIYYFSNHIDLGAKYTSRVRPTFKVDYLDYVNDFDSATGNFDGREGSFDGSPGQFDVTSASIELRHTDDDPSGTPTWSEWQDFIVADICARAVEFRAVLKTQSSAATPAVRELAAFIDMPERTESEQDITFTGSASISFPAAFRQAPALGISLANLPDGERYVITNKSRQGFDIEILNGSVTSTNPVTLDYVARGYGKEIV